MIRHACGQHVRQQTGHNCRSKVIVEPRQAFLCKKHVYVIEEIVNVLHRYFEILEAEFERQVCTLVEKRRVDRLPLRHR
jgi:hypothetical protein